MRSTRFWPLPPQVVQVSGCVPGSAPVPVQTSVSVAGVSEAWEGASRPTHFAGVATVVSKLFNIVGPCRAYFGEKDFQQLQVIRRLVRDLDIPVEIVGGPTARAVVAAIEELNAIATWRMVEAAERSSDTGQAEQVMGTRPR